MSLEVKIKKKLKEFTLESELNVETGCTGLMGPSGSGKSITLKCIAGVETADSGRIVLDGKILYDSEKKIDLPPQKRKIGYLFQGYALFPNMTIEENIKTGLRAKGFPKDEIEQKTNDMMKRFHIEELAKRYPRQISGGQKQRTALARMLVCEPEVILMYVTKNTIFKEVIWEKPHYYEILHSIFKKVRKLQMKKKFLAVLLAVAMVLGVTACGSSKDSSKSTTEAVKKEETTTITLAAAASLEKCYTEKLIPMFEKENKGIKVEGSYDSSGKLQSQIENGMAADVFMSAATEQMNNLVKGKYISKGDVVELLENKVVLIAPKKGDAKVSSFKDITKADTIALGDPKSVPAGQYAQEIFTNLKNWNDVKKKASFGTNVTEVLNWVAKGSASCGVVYATDAASNKDVKVLAEAPADALKTPVIYPVAALKKSKNKDAADKFVKFLQSEKALKVFRSYGFTINK